MQARLSRGARSGFPGPASNVMRRIADAEKRTQRAWKLAQAQQSRCSFPELRKELPDLWPRTTVELQQDLARAFDAVLAETKTLGGLFADPSGRGRLTFPLVATVRKAEDGTTKKWIALIYEGGKNPMGS